MDLLPRELWEHIAGFLTYDDVRSLSCTCKALIYLSKRRHVEDFIFELPSGEDPVKGRVNFAVNNQRYFLGYELYFSPKTSRLRSIFTCGGLAIASALFFDFDIVKFDKHFGTNYEAERRVVKCSMSGPDRRIYDNKIAVRFKFYPYSYGKEDEERVNERKRRRKEKALRRLIERQPSDRVYMAT